MFQPLPPFAARLRRVFLMSLLALGMLVLTPQVALAQDEEFDLNERINSMEFPVEPPLIKAAEIRDIIKALGLDASTGDLVRSLHEGYVTVYTAAATERRDRLSSLMDELREGDGSMDVQIRVGMEMQEIEKAWMKRRKAFGVDFFENVKATLTPDQLAKWPAFERDRRRRTQLHIGAFFAGEGVDVVKLLDELELEEPQRAAIAPLIESYEMEVDALLVQRMRAAEEVRNIDYTDPGALGNPFERFERVLALRRQIRDANRKHMQIISTSIPGPASEQLTRAFQAKCHPRIYAPTEADSFIETVLALEDLTTQQRAAVEGVAAMYRDQAAAANRQLAKFMQEHEDSIEKSLKGQNPMILAMVGGMSAYADEGMQAEQMPYDAKDIFIDEEQEKRQDELYRQKRDYVVSAIDQVWAVLIPSQQSSVIRPNVPEQTVAQKTARQIRQVMRQSMQYAEEAVREAQQEMEGGNPGR